MITYVASYPEIVWFAEPILIRIVSYRSWLDDVVSVLKSSGRAGARGHLDVRDLVLLVLRIVVLVRLPGHQVAVDAVPAGASEGVRDGLLHLQDAVRGHGVVDREVLHLVAAGGRRGKCEAGQGQRGDEHGDRGEKCPTHAVTVPMAGVRRWEAARRGAAADGSGGIRNVKTLVRSGRWGNGGWTRRNVMADKTNTSQGTGAAPAVDSPDAIRNVVLVGPSGSGKTTLVEALLVASGVLNRPGTVLDGTTVCDFDDAEIRQQRSVGLSLASLPHDGVKVNLIDTPGYADFVGELRAGLRAADCALFVISANEGVDEPTKSLWQECDQVGMPRAVVITKLDHARAELSERARRRAGTRSATRCCRCTCRARRDGLIGLLSQTHYGYADGKRSTAAPDASYADRDRGTARHPDRGNHRGVRGRVADGALPRRRGDRPEGADRRPREGGRARLVLPGDPGLQRHRRRHARAARGRHQRLPVAARASRCPSLHPAGRGRARA